MELMVGSEQAVRGRVLAQFTKDRPRPTRPVMDRRRTIAQLQSAAGDRRAKAEDHAAAEAARERAKRLAEMVADPTLFLRETERLVARRSTHAYREIAQLLADLREALAGTRRSDLAERRARKLKREHPTLNHLTAALRREGFIPK